MQNFDSAAPIVGEPFKIGDDSYEIREPDEATCCRYETARLQGFKFGPPDPVTNLSQLESVKNAEAVVSLRAILIGGCLARVGSPGTVGCDFASKMLRRISGPIYDECKRLYDAANEVEAAKN